MTPSLLSSIAAPLRKAGRCLLSAVLIVAVGGGLSMVAQGLAWVHMAQDAGGLHRLAEVMFEADPCERCQAAGSMSRGSGEDPDAPLRVQHLENLRFSATLTHRLPVPPATSKDRSTTFPIAHSDRALASRAYPPSLPPPRLFPAA